MADLTRWIIQLEHDAARGDADAAITRDRALAFLEARLANSDDVGAWDVIGASFLENLRQPGADFEQLKRRLGPALRTSLQPG